MGSSIFRVNNMANSDDAKRLCGKLSDFFAYKINADGEVEAGNKIN